jgi:uncharacterized damage-inducible protein DinB
LVAYRYSANLNSTREILQMEWIDREFDFSAAESLVPGLIERLRGAPARVEDLVSGVPGEILTRRDGDRWSIQENVGHLVKVEGLFLGRLDDYDAGAATLRPADMSNQRTWEAGFNDMPIEEILKELRRVRSSLVERLERMGAAHFTKSALHPRLEVPMRVCDMMLFEAEHDDHHLARISELLRMWRA